MFGIPLIEWIGYLASILIAISMFMKDIVKLRFINLVGSLLFAFYGFSISSGNNKFNNSFNKYILFI